MNSILSHRFSWRITCVIRRKLIEFRGILSDLPLCLQPFFFAFSFPDRTFILYHNTFVGVRVFSAVSQLRPCFLFGIGDVLCCDVSCRVGSCRVTPGPVALRRGASRPACPVLSCPVRSDWF